MPNMQAFRTPIKNGREKCWVLQEPDALGKKKAYEAEFQKRVFANPQWKTQYGNTITGIEQRLCGNKTLRLLPEITLLRS